MKSKNTNCGAATGLAPQSCMSDGFIIKQLDDLRADIDELNRIFSDYEKSQALRTETAHLEVTKDANIKKANIEDLTAPKAFIEDLNADKISALSINKKYTDSIAIENELQNICKFRGSARLDLKVDVLPGQSVESQGVQYISLRINDGVISAMSTDPIYINEVGLYRQNDGSLALFVNNILKKNNDVIVLRTSLFSIAEDLQTNVAMSYVTPVVKTTLINGVSVSGNINVDNKDAIKFENIDVTNLNVANKLKLGDFLLEYPKNTILNVPAGKVLYFWLRDGVLKVRNSPMLLRFADYKIIEVLGDPEYILSRPDDPTNSNGVLIKKADGTAFDISGEMAFYDTTGSSPIYFKVLDDASAFNPVVISKDGIHYLGRKSGVGSLVAKEVTTDVINTTDVNTEVLNATQLITTEELTADHALIKGLDVNDINFNNSATLPTIDPTKFQYMKISGLDSGMFCLKIMDGDLIAASITILRNTAFTSNTMVTYACQSIDDFLEIAEDVDGNIYLKLRYSGNTYYWGHTGLSKINTDPVILEPNEEPAGLFHEHKVHKLQHTIILGDGTNAYGLEVDGEILAKLIPFPDITSFEDVAVSNTFSVGGNSQFGGDVSITGNIYQKGDTYETHAQNLYTTEDMIITRDTKVLPDGTKVDPGPLADGELTGIKALHYDTAKNNGVLAFDNKGVARVGDEGDEKPIAVRDEAEQMKENHLAAWQGKNKDSGLGEDKLFTPDTIVEGFVRNAETHKAINIKGKNLDINSLDKNANVFGNVYTGLGNDWTVQENLPEEARGSVGFCLEVLPNSHNVIHVYTINKPSGVITWKRRYDNNAWGEWNKVSMLDKDGYVEKAKLAKGLESGAKVDGALVANILQTLNSYETKNSINTNLKNVNINETEWYYNNPGKYLIAKENITTIQGLPTNIYKEAPITFLNFVTNYSTSSYIQIAYSTSAYKSYESIYYRIMNGFWSTNNEWKEVATTDGSIEYANRFNDNGNYLESTTNINNLPKNHKGYFRNKTTTSNNIGIPQTIQLTNDTGDEATQIVGSPSRNKLFYQTKFGSDVPFSGLKEIATVEGLVNTQMQQTLIAKNKTFIDSDCVKYMTKPNIWGKSEFNNAIKESIIIGDYITLKIIGASGKIYIGLQQVSNINKNENGIVNINLMPRSYYIENALPANSTMGDNEITTITNTDYAKIFKHKSGETKYVKINCTWYIQGALLIETYSNYKLNSFIASGYNFSSNKGWLFPNIIGQNITSNEFTVKMGYDTANNVYISFPIFPYGGVKITGVPGSDGGINNNTDLIEYLEPSFITKEEFDALANVQTQKTLVPNDTNIKTIADTQIKTKVNAMFEYDPDTKTLNIKPIV